MSFFKAVSDYAKAASITARTLSTGFLYNGWGREGASLAAASSFFGICDTYMALETANTKSNSKINDLIQNHANNENHANVILAKTKINRSRIIKNIALAFMIAGITLDAVSIFRAFNSYSSDPNQSKEQEKSLDHVFSQIRYLGLSSLFISQISEWFSKLSYKNSMEYIEEKLSQPVPRLNAVRT